MCNFAIDLSDRKYNARLILYETMFLCYAYYACYVLFFRLLCYPNCKLFHMNATNVATTFQAQS